MPDVTQMLPGRALTPRQAPVADGYVSKRQPAPVTFEDPVRVILPDYSGDRSWSCAWPAIHGNTKPAQGAAVTVIFNSTGVPVVVWWEGTHS